MSGFQMTELAFNVPAPNLVPLGYFRSKLFSSHAASNPLVAAASPLLSLLERLGVSQTLPAIEQLRDNIEHELFAFHSRLTNQQFNEDSIALSHYLLCATLDELIGKNYLRLKGEPTTFKAFTPSSNNQLGPETQFFVILDHLSTRANQYLDILELTYYCLIAGFEGEHHLKTDGRQILDNLIDDIHKTILQHRVHKPQLLFKESIHRSTAAPQRYIKSLMLTVTMSTALLISCYMGMHHLLNHQAQTLLHHYASQTHSDH